MLLVCILNHILTDQYNLSGFRKCRKSRIFAESFLARSQLPRKSPHYFQVWHKERPGLHTCALWEIRPQLALVESFPQLLYIITCYWLHFNLAALASSNLLSISSRSFLMSLVSSSDKLTWSKWFFPGQILLVPGFKNSVHRKEPRPFFTEKSGDAQEMLQHIQQTQNVSPYLHYFSARSVRMTSTKRFKPSRKVTTQMPET